MRGKLPPLALANDNFTDFMLEYIIVNKVTYAEIVAASVVHPVMSQMEVSVCDQWNQVRGHDMLQKAVHEHDGIMGSIGSITAYVLGFEEYVAQLKPFVEDGSEQDARAKLPELPLEPREVAMRCSFRLYATKDFLKGEKKERLLQQALIRAEVVVELIRINVARKLPGYVEYAKLPDWEKTIKERADLLYPRGAELHPEIASVFERCEEWLSVTAFEVKEGKAAVPAAPTTDIDLDPFTHAQPFGLGFGASASDGLDENERMKRGLLNLEEAAKRTQPRKLRLDHGDLIETFTPAFFCIAYPVLFPRGGAWLDYYRNRSDRRTAEGDEMPKVDAPRVELNRFCELMGRSAQLQFKRDPTFLFCLKDLWHRTQVNNAKTYYSIENAMRKSDGRDEMDRATDIVNDIHDLLARLYQTFTTERGATVNVRGDFTKLCMMPTLNERQRKMLHSLDMTARTIPGTQDVRNLMGKYMTGCCVRYGTPFMCTISPSVYHSMLVFHLHRGLEADPIYLRDVDLKRWIAMDKPTLTTYHDADGNVSSFGIFVPLKGLDVPTFNERQKIIAQDPLACVNGFRTLVQLVLRTMFGVRVCSDCPARSAKCACQDRFGSVSNVEGGVFGLVEAYAASIEAQLAGWLHTHILIWLSWVYQHHTMYEIAKMLIGRLGAFARGMADLDHWKDRCCSETFAEPNNFNEIELDNIETTWTTKHREDAGLLVHGYSDRVGRMSADEYRAWQDKNSDIRTGLSMLHVHPKDQSGHRRVQRSCLQKSEKAKRKRLIAKRKGQALEECRTCKYNFPKEELKRHVVLCKRLARKVYCRAPGYRAKIGQHEGPRYGYRTAAGYCRKAVPLGETHPAIVTVTGCNFHVRRTDKTPPVGAAHSDECKSKACRRASSDMIRKLTRATAQIARQSVKYVTSYTAKTQPIAKEKVKNFGKIHDHRLRQFKAGVPIGKDKRRETLSNFARRGVTRLLSDTITKARTMYGPEALNLMLNSRANDSTSAEAFYSASQVSLPCRQLRLELSSVRTPRCHTYTTKRRMSIQGKEEDARFAPDTSNFSAWLYGLRPAHAAIWQVPPYQFWLNWYFCRATFPSSIAEDKRSANPKHCKLTDAGKRYFLMHGRQCDEPFIAGEHYELAGTSGSINGQQWIALHESAPPEWRNQFVIVRHNSPKVPYFQYAFDANPSKESRALALLAYFSPWTSIEDAATTTVPFAATIASKGTTYAQAWERYVTEGVPCVAVKNYIRDFMMMHARSDGTALESDNEENCEDTSRLPSMSTTELHETRERNGQKIDVGMWEAIASQSATPITANNTRDALDFMVSGGTSAEDPDLQSQPRHGNATSLEKRTWWTFFSTTDVEQIIDSWLRGRENVNNRRIKEQERFITDFTGYLKHRASEVNTLLQHTADTEKLAPPTYFVTGMPGTGKSFVTQELRSLFSALGMAEGVDYVFTAYMASTARQSNGTTIHHILNLGKHGKAGVPRIDADRLQVLVVEEISMVPADLLAKLETECRILAKGKNSPW